jgi:oxygen-dependent protoporphyrinogen oxidase
MQAAMPQFLKMEQEYGGLIRAAWAKRSERSTDRQQQSARQASGARYDQFVAPKLGMSWWLGKLAEPLGDRLHLNTAVTQVRRMMASQSDQREDATSTGRWRLTLRDAQGQSRVPEDYDVVILALPAYASAELLAAEQTALASELRAIPYASSAIAVLDVKRSEIHPDAFCFGSIAPTIEHRDCLAISLSSEKYSGRCPPDRVLMRVFMGGAVRPELLERSDAELMGMARREVQALFGSATPPAYEHMVRWERAMPQYLVGHVERVRAIRALASAIPGLELIGNAYDGVGIPQCIRGAKQAVLRQATRFHTS